MRWLNYFVAVCLLFALGCRPGAPESIPGDAKSYGARGVIRHIPGDQHSITIAHEAIPGYMAAMTMEFPVKDTNELSGLAIDDVITFSLVVRGDEDWVTHLKPTGQTAPSPPPPPKASVDELKPGDAMPDFEFTAEDGSSRHLADFRGQALAFTFFFTSCPLPDYCPRMNKNLAEARQLLMPAAGSSPTNWEFLSISFDSGFDTPEVLTNYAGAYRGSETNHWLFAVIGTNTLAAIAPRLDLMVMHTGSSISHNLRTVVLDSQGRIAKLFDGNEWTPQQLADAVVAAARAR